MCRKLLSQRLARLCVGTLATFVALERSAAQTSTPGTAGRGIHEVTANSVYVRSGGSLNHYPICKLNAGDRVTVVGAAGDWFEILPPAGTFSLVHGDYVDTADDQEGVINGDNVRLRAGSQLSEHKYTVQRLLSKGMEVTILGRNPDGFVRILPPDGATVWIASEFLAPLHSGGVVAAPTQTDAAPKTTMTPRSASRVPAPSVDTKTESLPIESPSAEESSSVLPESSETVISHPEVSVIPPSLQSLPATPEREMLSRIEKDIEVELGKALLDRQFDTLIVRLKGVVASNDEFAGRYAEARIAQLNTMAEIADTVRTVRGLGDQTDAQRLEFLAERTERTETVVPKRSGIDAKGVLRVSALYPATRSPRRFRLVDHSGGMDRTIAYVDVPRETEFDASRHLERYVGIRASQKRLLPGAAEPIPVLTAKEIVVLDAPVLNTMKSVEN